MWAERLKGKVYAGGVLAVLLYGCESWCLTEESVRRLGICKGRIALCSKFGVGLG